jgi:hypothetical protein
MQTIDRRAEMVRTGIQSHSYPKRSFGLLDFVYFSGVTQTTVGYGDILPNPTGIRMLVLATILLGYAPSVDS